MTLGQTNHDVFISFSSQDQAKARSICERLELAGLNCWISLRNVKPGTNYQESIVLAIQTAKVMVVTFSDNTNRSQEVHKELSLASAFRLAVMPVRIAVVQPVGALLYELATRQWIDAFDDWDAAMERLVATAKTCIGRVDTSAVPFRDVVVATTSPALPSAPAQSVSPSAIVFSQDQLAAARGALAHYIGPIADVLVRKASAKSTSLLDFHERLVAHIRDPDERSAFRRRLEKISAAVPKPNG